MKRAYVFSRASSVQRCQPIISLLKALSLCGLSRKSLGQLGRRLFQNGQTDPFGQKGPMTFVRKVIEMDEEKWHGAKAESWNIMSNSRVGVGGVKGAGSCLFPRQSRACPRCHCFPDSANGGSESCIFGMPSRTSRNWLGPSDLVVEGVGTGLT